MPTGQDWTILNGLRPPSAAALAVALALMKVRSHKIPQLPSVPTPEMYPIKSLVT